MNVNKLMEKFESKLGPIADKISSNRYLNAIQAGFMTSMPLVVIGAIMLVIACFPIPAVTNFIASIFGPNWTAPLFKFNTVSNDVIGIFVLLGTALNLAKEYKMDLISTGAITFSGYLVLTPFTETGDIPKAAFGAANLFMVLIVAIATVEIVRFVLNKNWTIKMPDSVPPAVQNSFTALIPAGVVLLLYVIIGELFALTPFGDMGTFINTVVQTPLVNVTASLPGVLIFILFEMLFWSFGIHGSNIVGAIFTPMFTALTTENATAVAAGLAAPNVINMQFYTNFVRLGGAGANLGLLMLMLFIAKSKQYKSLGKLAAPPLAFQINEPIIFGFPLVMNPLMMVPFIFGPMVIAIICYIAFSIGLVPCCNGAAIPWNCPPIVSGFLLCGWRGAVLQLVCLVVNMLCWLPFFRVADKKAYEAEQAEEAQA